MHGRLKTFTGSVRGKGSRRHVESSNALPRYWQEFLRNDENKSELFPFLSLHIGKLEIETERQIITTHHRDMLLLSQRTQLDLLLVLTKKLIQGFSCMFPMLPNMHAIIKWRNAQLTLKLGVGHSSSSAAQHWRTVGWFWLRLKL